jgi:uracil phosphoribosyltransferase
MKKTTIKFSDIQKDPNLSLSAGHYISKKEKLVKSAKEILHKYLKYCDEKHTPYVCKLNKEPNGAKQIEVFVLDRMLNTGNPVGECIMTLERILDPVYSEH